MLAASIDSVFSLDRTACGPLLAVLPTSDITSSLLYINGSNQGVFTNSLPLRNVTLTLSVTNDDTHQ